MHRIFKQTRHSGPDNFCHGENVAFRFKEKDTVTIGERYYEFRSGAFLMACRKNEKVWQPSHFQVFLKNIIYEGLSGYV